MNRLVTTPEDEPGESTVVACDAAPPEEVLVLERGKDLGHDRPPVGGGPAG